MLFKEIISENWKPKTLLKQISVIVIFKNLGNHAHRALKKWKYIIYLEFNWKMPNRHKNCCCWCWWLGNLRHVPIFKSYHIVFVCWEG
jgi:hypothetical protein